MIEGRLPGGWMCGRLAYKKETKVLEGATIGVGTASVIGGTIGLLASIGELAILGLGSFIAAGPIIAALSAGAIGAGVCGLTGALIGLGIPEYEAKNYEGKVKEGGILISVHSESNDDTTSAKSIFKEEGAHDISSTGEAHADVKAQDLSELKETSANETSPLQDIAASQVTVAQESAPIFLKANHQLESRSREIRPSGSEGGAT